LTEEDNFKLNKGFEYAKKTFSGMCKMMQIINLELSLTLEGKEIPEWLQTEEERLIDLFQKGNESIEAIEKLVNENPLKAMINTKNMLETYPLNAALDSVYRKYELPKRRQRYRKQGKALSQYPYGSKKPGDYSGIENMK
jgi:hypothetical protein